jgi:hypothetical protein
MSHGRMSDPANEAKDDRRRRSQRETQPSIEGTVGMEAALSSVQREILSMQQT